MSKKIRQQNLDKSLPEVYTTNRKGAAGKRVAPVKLQK